MVPVDLLAARAGCTTSILNTFKYSTPGSYYSIALVTGTTCTVLLNLVAQQPACTAAQLCCWY